jgi:intergrase/recombinase
LKGLTIDEAIKEAKNSWMKKTLKLYLRYLFENNMISEDEYLRYRMKIKVKQSNHRKYRYIPDKKVRDSVWSIVGVPHQFLVYLALVFSGVRRNELWKMLREYDPNKLFCTEEFCRYELSWIRGRKRCDYIYLPRWLLEKLLEYRDKLASIREDSLENLVKRRRRMGEEILPTSELRDWHYNVCLELLEVTSSEDPRINICRLYQGRELNVSGEYYQFLVRKADAFYPKLQREIMNRVSIEEEDLKVLGKIKKKVFIDYFIGDPDIEVDEERVVIEEHEDEEELIDEEEEQLVYEYRAEF